MLPVRVRETGIRVPFGALTGEMGRVSVEGKGGSAERGASNGNGCERARAREYWAGRAPAYDPVDESAVREDCKLGRGIALGLLFEYECECEEVDVPGRG